jgi:hypothetical protein
MKTFNEFCAEAYQLDEVIKPLLKTALRGTAIGTGIDYAVNKAAGLFPKPMQPGVKKIADIASWGALAPIPAAIEVYKDDQRREAARRQAAQAQSSSLPPGARWYGRPEDDVRPKSGDDSRLLARGRRYTRNYEGIGTQKP